MPCCDTQGIQKTPRPDSEAVSSPLRAEEAPGTSGNPPTERPPKKSRLGDTSEGPVAAPASRGDGKKGSKDKEEGAKKGSKDKEEGAKRGSKDKEEGAKRGSKEKEEKKKKRAKPTGH